METYAGPHRAFCVRAYYRNGDSIVTAQRLYRAEYHTRNAPSENSIRRWIHMFENTGATIQIPSSSRSRTVRDEETIEEVRGSVRQNPSLSVRKRAQQLNIKKSSLHVILKKDLHLKAYKIQLVQELKDVDFVSRVNFANEMINRFTNFENILFSDEANFHLNGHVNKQNCRYWSSNNPKQKHGRPLHSPKVIVWAGFFSLQQDGATCHTSDQSLQAVNELFPNKVISRRGNINWPPRSPDLSPLDYFLWGYLKGKVYDNKPTNLAQLKHNITLEMAAISRATCSSVMRNFRSRLEECLQRDGRHLDNIIFKK